MAIKTYAEAIRDALAEEMRRDPSIFVFGEDVGLYGGAYGATKGLFEEFGEARVKDTPISEAAIAGVCVGASMCGMRPVGEIQYMDFTTIAMDQLVNHGAKNRYMFGGKTKLPFVMRTQGGAGRSIAAQHSQSLEAWFVHAPGILVAAPSTPYDAKGMLKYALRQDDPVLFVEHKLLYATKGEVPEDDYTVPFGVAAVRREGGRVSVVSYGRQALNCVEACDKVAKDGIGCDVIDLRTLKPLDIETVLASVRKTGRVLLVSEAVKTCNFVCEVAMRINEFAFDYLDAPIRRLCGADVPMPMSPPLEAAAVPSVASIEKAIRELAAE